MDYLTDEYQAYRVGGGGSDHYISAKYLIHMLLVTNADNVAIIQDNAVY